MISQIINLSILISFTVAAEICDEEWKLINTANGSVLWNLCNAPNSDGKFSLASKICESQPGTTAAIVRNPAEKRLLADLATGFLEPMAVCYESSQLATDKFKSIDYEEPPEYLKILNKKGKVKLSRKIKKNDQITISFSFKISKKKLKSGDLKGSIRIGSSSNDSLFAVDFKCNRSNTYTCGFETPYCIHLGTAEEKSRLTVQYFGTITFKFNSQQILIWDQCVVPSFGANSYTKMDEISIENLLVTNIDHSTICKSTEYTFETKKLLPDPIPILSDPDKMEVKPRNIGSNFTYFMAKDWLNYWNENDENPFVFDIFMSQNQNIKRFWGNINVEFLSEERDESIFKLHLDANKLSIDYLNNSNILHSEAKSPDNMIGHRRLLLRFHVSVKSDHIEVNTTVVRLGKPKTKISVKVEIWNLAKIQMSSDSAQFFDVKMKALREVMMTTCNFRRRGIEELQMTSIPYSSSCFKHKVLCQKPALAPLEGDPPDEPREKYLWKDKVEEVEEERKEEIKREEMRKEEKRKKNMKRIKNINEFQWIIVGLTSATIATILAILILNLIHCWI